MNPKISILVPVYKTEEYIGRCLESIQNQTFQDFEVIVVDDGSPDDAMKIVEKAAHTDPRIQIIYHESNQGLMMTRRSGYLNAKGDFMVFVDSDDTLPVDALEILHNEITKSGTDIVIGGFQYIGGKRSQNLKKQYPKVLGYFTSTEVFHLLLNHKLNHNLWSCIFNANLFNKDLVCYDHQTNGEDAILFYQLIGNSIKIKIINNITYNYHLEGESSTRSVMTEDKIKQLIVVQNFRYNYLTKRGIPTKEIMKYIANVYVSLMQYNSFNFLKECFEKDILIKLKIPNIISYLSITSIIKYSLYKLGIGIVK